MRRSRREPDTYRALLARQQQREVNVEITFAATNKVAQGDPSISTVFRTHEEGKSTIYIV